MNAEQFRSRLHALQAALGRAVKLLAIESATGLALGILATRVLAGVVLAMALLGLVPTRIPAQRALSVDPLVLLARSNHSLGGSSLFAPCEKKPRCPRQVHPTTASQLAKKARAATARFTPKQLPRTLREKAPAVPARFQQLHNLPEKAPAVPARFTPQQAA